MIINPFTYRSRVWTTLPSICIKSSLSPAVWQTILWRQKLTENNIEWIYFLFYRNISQLLEMLEYHNTKSHVLSGGMSGYWAMVKEVVSIPLTKHFSSEWGYIYKYVRHVPKTFLTEIPDRRDWKLAQMFVSFGGGGGHWWGDKRDWLSSPLPAP